MTVPCRLAPLCLAALVAACSETPHAGGDAGDGSGDAGEDDAGDGSVVEPAPPAPPEEPTPPALVPCPPGWREIRAAGDEPATCDPWPATGPETCGGVDEAHFPGEPGCVRIGSACPAGTWAEDLPADATIRYVRADALPGGDGSEAAPFGTITEAATAAPAGTVIALSRGTFDEVVVLTGGVTLWGACVAETLVASSAAARTEGTVTVFGREVVVRNLRVGGDRIGVLLDGASRSATLQDVVVEGVQTVGVAVFGGSRLTARGLVVRDVRSSLADGRFGRGMSVEDGSQADVGRAVLERNAESGLCAHGAGSLAVLADAAMRGTRAQASDRRFGMGLAADAEGRIEAERVAVEGNRYVGVYGTAGGSVALTDAVVRDTLSQESDGEGGGGLVVRLGSAAILARVLLERNLDGALVASEPGTTLEAGDVVVRDTGSEAATGARGRGLAVDGGAGATVARAVFVRNREVGANADGPGTLLSLADAVVRVTLPAESDSRMGRGIDATAGARLEIVRVRVEGNRGCGVLADGAGTTLSLQDLAVRDTEADAATETLGRGLVVQRGATADGTRVLLEANREVGAVAAGEGARLDVTDLVVRDTRSQLSDGWHGRGLSVQGGAQMTVERALLERNRDVGAFAMDPGTILTAVDLEIRDTLPRECVDSTCVDAGAGIGIFSGTDAAVTVTRFLDRRAALAGVMLHGGGTVDLHEGEVSFHPIGVNVQTAGFEVSRLMDRVVYRDNERDFDGEALPVPVAGDPAGI